MRLHADGTPRRSIRRISGMAVRVVSDHNGGRFLQCAGTTAAQVRDLGGELAGAVDDATRRRATDGLLSTAGLVDTGNTPATDAGISVDWLAAAREGALANGADAVETRWWCRDRAYAVWRDDSLIASRTCLMWLTVSARTGTTRGSSVVAHLPAAPLTVEAAAQAGAAAAGQARRLGGAAVPRSGPTPVIFAPDAAGAFVHEVLGHALEADIAETSAMWARRTQLDLHPALSVFDDSRVPQSWEQTTVDEEGTPCGRVTLVDRGRVVGRLTDQAHARPQGAVSTGHGRRGLYSSPPIPRMRHTIVTGGSDDAVDIVADTRHGVMVLAIESADAIPAQGRFVMRVRDAVEVVDGRAGRPLTSFSVTGDLADLALLDAVGSDNAPGVLMCGRQGRWVPVSHDAPTLRLPRLTVRGRS
ncbi:metallopeptidase TldD-related protein [Streptomyces sp. MI02-7b]|nr:metallopeptidase TldD-related protein [Streptomyces sp. MI02-7b]